ncbi:MAG: secretin N-terminal domain-containing protein, partial [Candidatus Omnitrophota bacterium]
MEVGLIKKNNILTTAVVFWIIILCWTGISNEQEPQAGLAPANVTEQKEEAKLQVDLDLKDADIRDVARAFARIGGINIIVSQDAQAKVTLKIQSTDWKEALMTILGAYNLAMLEGDNYIVITTLEGRRQAEEKGDLQTRVISFNFVDVGQIKATLTSMLTSRGKMEVDVRSNSLVITDIPDRIDKIQAVALQLDTKTPQVMIEAMVMTVKLTDDEQWGVDWLITHKDLAERKILQGLSLADSSSAYAGYIKYGKTIFPWAVFNATIDFWLRNKKAEILANPRILTLDNLAATIDLTEQVAYTQTSQTTESSTIISSTQFKEVPVKLIVKPHITKDNYVFMTIHTEQSYQSGTSGGQPIIDSRRAETNLMVKDGETIVIGGLRKKEQTRTVEKMPVLGDIPLLGTLFRRA